ncbi:MAG TPA: hypothetical protein DF383_04155 [Deltaproteobacteria bacterium]|nr:hypothetical protein [Deltaproteobacteria bacterium]
MALSRGVGGAGRGGSPHPFWKPPTARRRVSRTERLVTQRRGDLSSTAFSFRVLKSFGGRVLQFFGDKWRAFIGLLKPKPINPLLNSGPIWGRDFRKLNLVVGLISSGMRADSSRSHQVGMEQRYTELMAGRGMEDLASTLAKQKVPVKPAHLKDDINQTSDENRSIVELISNSLDASKGDVHVTLRDGFYEVTDTGKGMSAFAVATRLLIPKLSGKPDVSQQIGRFGIGFYTVLRHLQSNGESVVVETRSEGEAGYRLTFRLEDGEIWFRSEEVRGLAAGTKVQVKAAEIREEAMRQEIWRYLRYTDPTRSVRVNGNQINQPLETVLEIPFGESRGALQKNPHGSGITVMVGGIAVEHYPAEGRGGIGEWVLALPREANLAITRDLVQLDTRLFGYLRGLVEKTEDLEKLNALVPLFEAFEKRDPPESLMSLLRERAKAVVEEKLQADPGLKVYPDQKELKLSQGSHLYVHPELFAERWWSQFEVPKEFQWGEKVNGVGKKHPVRLVLSEEIQTPIHYDSDLGVIYLSKQIYETQPAFVLSALFMIENLRFRVGWGESLERAAVEVVAERKVEKLEAQPAVKEAPADAKFPLTGETEFSVVNRFLEEYGVSLKDFALVFTGQDLTFARSGSELFVKVRKVNKCGLLNHSLRSILPIEYDYVGIHSHGSEPLLLVKKDGKWGLLDRSLRSILFNFQ